MSKAMQPDQATRLEARVVQLQSQVTVLEQRIIDQQHVFDSDLNLVKQQLATLFLLQQNGNSTSSHENVIHTAASPIFNLSVVDLIAYANKRQKKQTDDDFFALLLQTCESIDPLLLQKSRLVEDLSALNQILGTGEFQVEYNGFLMAVASKLLDYTPPTILISFFQSIGLPLYQAGSTPTPFTTSFYPFGSFMTNHVTTETKFVHFAGLSKFSTFASIFATYPLSLHTNNPNAFLLPIFKLLSLNIRIDFHLLSTFKQFQTFEAGVERPPLASDARSTGISSIYNFLLHRTNDFSNKSDPKITFFELYYFMVFILHAMHYASEHLDVFTLRHPFVNFLLGDEELINKIKLWDVLSDQSFLQLTQDLQDYGTFCSIFKRQLNDCDSNQPVAYSNKPQQYLRLSTNGDVISQYKWAAPVVKQLSKELAL